MRSPDKTHFALLGRGIATFALAASLSACASGQGGANDSLRSTAAAPAQNGPSADYPITVGAPYFVNGTEYVPTDTMNYDHVGYLAVDSDAMGYTGSHHTLPLPSYVEVTSLETGRTILIRLERRGPMNANNVLALSPAALAQLGAGAETPVRVRRVNPPETERFLLRAGDAAPLRMNTPASLLTVLQRRLPETGVASLGANAPESEPQPAVQTVELAPSDAPEASVPEVLVAETSPELPPALPPIETVDEEPQTGTFAAAFSEEVAQSEEPAPMPEAAQVQPATEGRFVVQAAAFSTRDRADRVAATLGGVVTQSGRYFRVRTGPFATRGEAEASLANVRRAGYSDARILTSG